MCVSPANTLWFARTVPALVGMRPERISTRA